MDGEQLTEMMAVSIPIITIIALFTYLTIASWANARRKEREAYYKSETLKKLAEVQGNAGGSIVEFLREEDQMASRRRTEGQKLGGLINAAVGIGVMIFLGRLIPNKAIWLAGLIPLLVGAALLTYAYALAPRSEKAAA